MQLRNKMKFASRYSKNELNYLVRGHRLSIEVVNREENLTNQRGAVRKWVGLQKLCHRIMSDCYYEALIYISKYRQLSMGARVTFRN